MVENSSGQPDPGAGEGLVSSAFDRMEGGREAAREIARQIGDLLERDLPGLLAQPASRVRRARVDALNECLAIAVAESGDLGE